MKPTLYGLTFKEAEELIVSLSEQKFRAKQLLDWIYQKNIPDLKQAKNLPPDFILKLNEQYDLSALNFSEAVDGGGESVKYLFKTRDERLLESVLIKQRGRRTVCVSTQLGCKIGCVFCASGKGKFGRNLTPGEIVEQVAQIQNHIGNKITNIVFMGMGEPLDNFEATMKSLEILQAEWGFGMGGRRITVSTSGITPKIVEFVERNVGRVRLSISLHSSQEAKRTELVPINKKYSLKELVATLNQLNENLKRKITFEYTLIADVNDSAEEAEGVAGIAAPIDAMVNIIPYNPIREMEFKTPAQEKIDMFRRILEKRGVRVIVRQTAGRGIDAACGQLRLDREGVSDKR